MNGFAELSGMVVASGEVVLSVVPLFEVFFFFLLLQPHIQPENIAAARQKQMIFFISAPYYSFTPKFCIAPAAALSASVSIGVNSSTFFR